MGTWAAGNLDNDAALDHLGELIDQLSEQIAEGSSSEDLAIDDGFDEVMADVAILRILCTHTPAAPPKPATIEKWQKRLLQVFDHQIDELEPEQGFKEARREAIVKAFEELRSRAQTFWKA